MSAELTVSAVVPAYNTAALLPRCIESILTQTVAVDEVIVVDDGSVDKTREVAESFGPRVRCISQANKGAAGARNCGIRSATGEWIALLDSDDDWVPNKIERQLEAVRQHPECDFIYSDATVILPDGSTAENFQADKEAPCGWVFDHLLQSCFVNGSTVMARRSALMEAGLFNESLRCAEDYDLWLRVSRRHQFWFVPEPLAFYERQAESLTRNDAVMAASQIAVLEPILAERLSATQHSGAKKHLASAYFSLSYATRERDAREAVSLAWRSWRNNPRRLASVKLLAGSLLAAAKAPTAKR